MFTGSMCGSGTAVFAVFTYAIVNARPDLGSIVSLNPLALSGVFGEEPATIESAIEELCNPDPLSRTEAEEGRRLIRMGNSMDYRVVNLEKYRYLDGEEQRAYWRERKREQRNKKGYKQSPEVVDNQKLSRTNLDIGGQAGHCPHAKANADAKANAKEGVQGNGESPLKLSPTERISLEQERRRLDERVKDLKKNEFRTEKQTQEMKDGRVRIHKIDTALHIPL